MRFEPARRGSYGRVATPQQAISPHPPRNTAVPEAADVAPTEDKPAAITVVSVLIGAALLGLIGALVAIPAAAAIRLLLQEVTFRRMDKT
jgi:hypothetical protein